MNNICDLTYKIIAFSEIPDFNTDECIDWAIEMIGAGYESESTLILSGLTKPTNYFEAMAYLKEALKELNIQPRRGYEGRLSYCFYYITKIANGVAAKENLRYIQKYYQTHDEENMLSKFYLLYWAWDDLEYGLETQHYWHGANKDNIEEIVIAVAQQWLLENSDKVLKWHTA